ncbi:MAG: LamG domain-containing protein, partial [Kiritimatiellae bacterium]|nr:LamG domain-containing protein [Kiritimatiellia bacterium]
GSVVKDLSGGGHDGRVEGDGLEVVRGIGKQGKAVRFDGKVDYIRVPRDEALEPDEITVAAWVKVRAGFASCGGDGIGAVVFKRNTSFHDNEDYCLEIHPGCVLRTDLSSPHGRHAKVTTREALAPELWHHIAVAVGGGMARIYVDGVLAVEQSHRHPFDHSRMTDLFVGARDHAGHPIDRFGAFDLAELAIWDEVLGAEQVAALYRERAGHFGVAKREAKEKKGLVLHYAFGKGGKWKTGSVVKDLSGGGHNGWVEGDGLEVAKGMGNRGKAARFDGKGDFIRVPRDEALEGEEITVAAWVKVRAGDAWENGATIAFKRNSSFNHNEGYCLEIFPDRTVRATVSGPSAAQCRMESTVPMEDGVWHHVAMVHAPGDTRLYVDGALAGQGKFPQEVMHNPEADLLIAGRDHAQYPTDRFGLFDLAEVKIWDEALGTEQVGALYREWAGGPGIGKSASVQSAVVEFGAERRLTWKGIEPEFKVFPAWKPTKENARNEARLAAELRDLVAQGRRDRAGSPEFLDALEKLLEKQALEDEKPSDKLPVKPDFRGPGMPAGWSAVDPTVWRFGDGGARQILSKANTRYVLYYDPGMAWRDYEVRMRFESDKWFPPPANSCAALWVRYKGVDDAYCVNFDGNGNLSVISCEQGGKGRVIVRTAVGAEVIKDGRPWTVRVRGEEIVVEHEGRRYLEVHDGAHREGTVGLESIHIPMTFSGVEISNGKGQ